MILRDFNNNLLSKEHELFVLKNMKEEMLHLINICKEDYQSKEAAIERNEFKEILKADPELKKASIQLVNRVDSMIFKCWLFSYKGRGYVLCDIGNGSFSYVCTAEEALVGIHYHKFQSEY